MHIARRPRSHESGSRLKRLSEKYDGAAGLFDPSEKSDGSIDLLIFAWTLRALGARGKCSCQKGMTADEARVVRQKSLTVGRISVVRGLGRGRR